MKKDSKNQKCSLFHYFRKIAKTICQLVSLLFFLGIIFLIMRFLILAINLRFPTFSIAFPVGIQSQEDSKSEKNTPSADVSPTILSNITPEPTVAKTILPDVTPELIVVNTTTAPTVNVAPTPTSTATTAPTPTPIATTIPTPTATVAPTPIPTTTATPFITPATSPTPLIRITTVAPYYFSEDISKKHNENVPTNTPDVPINTPNVTSTPVCVSSTPTSTPKKMESYLSTTSVDFSQIMYNNLITQHEFTLPEKKVSVIWKNTEIIFSSSTLSLIELSISSAILDQLSQIPVKKICIQDLASIDITQLVECMHEFEGSKIILGWERDDINSPYQFRIKMNQSLFSILFHGKYNYDFIESN